MPVAGGMLIGGRWSAGADGNESMKVIDKYTGETMGTVPAATKSDVAQATESASRAFAAWSATPAHKRSDILRRTAEGIAARRRDLTVTICREAGKAWKHAAGEVSRAIETFTFAAEEAKRIHGETIPM